MVLDRPTGKDTVPVTGIALRFRVGDMSSGADEPRFAFVARVVNDRLVLDSLTKQ